MANLNTTYLIGYLTANPELRHIPSGTAVAEFTIAAHRRLRSGEEDVLFMPVTVWGKMGESCAKHLQKGSSVLIVGFLKQEAWTSPEGQRKSIIKLVAEQVQFMPRGQQQQQGQQYHQQQQEQGAHRYGPADAEPPQPPPVQPPQQPDDDIPF